MILIEDKAQKEGQHVTKNHYWEEQGVLVQRHPLAVGDYIIANEKVLDVISRKTKRGMAIKKMDFLGTYTATVDTKKDMMELYGDVIGKQHARFRDECILAQNNGIKLYILVENTDGLKEVRDVFKWQNPRMHRYNKIRYMHNIGKWENIPLPSKPPVSGEQFAKSLLTMELKYGVKFVFCKPSEAGQKVIELLSFANNYTMPPKTLGENNDGI